MVLMKNAANAFAPSGVCWVASSGMIGGFSPGRMLGPRVGTSAGSVGRAGAGGPPNPVELGTEPVGGTVTGAEPVGPGRAGAPAPPPDEHATHANISNAAYVPIRTILE